MTWMLVAQIAVIIVIAAAAVKFLMDGPPPQ